MNFCHLMKAPAVEFRVPLRRKSCLDENQSARIKVDYVMAHDKDEAKHIALAKYENQAFIADGERREAR